MSKYIDTEKLRAEIERLKGICTAQIKANPGQTFPFVMEMTGYDKIFSFLDTLESEKPMNQDGLEEEIDRLWGSFADEMEGPHNLFDIYARLARHFAQWQKEQMLKEAVEGKIEEVSFNNGELHNTIFFSFDEESLHVENRIWFPRCGKDGDKVRIIIVKEDRK